MVRELHAAGFAGGVAELSAAVIVEYWLGCDFHRERGLRAILAAFAAVGGVLDAGVGRHLQGRRINQITKSRPNPPYSDAEWRRLAAACTELIRSSRRAHQEVLAAIARGADPVEHGTSPTTWRGCSARPARPPPPRSWTTSARQPARRAPAGARCWRRAGRFTPTGTPRWPT
jgi:hypothetical protein